MTSTLGMNYLELPFFITLMIKEKIKDFFEYEINIFNSSRSYDLTKRVIRFKHFQLKHAKTKLKNTYIYIILYKSDFKDY